MKKSRDFSPKMFATGGERCPVSLFKEYLTCQPNHLRTRCSFYLSINCKPKDEVWYKAQPMGNNRINEMMKRIVAGTSLESSSKKLTNHNAWNTLVNKLRNATLNGPPLLRLLAIETYSPLTTTTKEMKLSNEISLQKYLVKAIPATCNLY